MVSNPRISFAEDTRLNADTEEQAALAERMQSGAQAGTAPEYHFICECFFLTAKGLHLGLLRIINACYEAVQVGACLPCCCWACSGAMDLRLLASVGICLTLSAAKRGKPAVRAVIGTCMSCCLGVFFGVPGPHLDVCADGLDLAHDIDQSDANPLGCNTQLLLFSTPSLPF